MAQWKAFKIDSIHRQKFFKSKTFDFWSTIIEKRRFSALLVIWLIVEKFLGKNFVNPSQILGLEWTKKEQCTPNFWININYDFWSPESLTILNLKKEDFLFLAITNGRLLGYYSSIRAMHKISGRNSPSYTFCPISFVVYEIQHSPYIGYFWCLLLQFAHACRSNKQALFTELSIFFPKIR